MKGSFCYFTLLDHRSLAHSRFPNQRCWKMFQHTKNNAGYFIVSPLVLTKVVVVEELLTKLGKSNYLAKIYLESKVKVI